MTKCCIIVIAKFALKLDNTVSLDLATLFLCIHVINMQKLKKFIQS